MTFLELCQQVALDSGTVQSGPQSVVSQTGRLKEIVGWTRDAWRRIQMMTPPWAFMNQEFTAPLAIGTASYALTDLGLTDASFLLRSVGRQKSMSNYETATGVSTEGDMHYVEYADFLARYGRGTVQHGRPLIWSVTFDGRLVVAPTPDRLITIRGTYRRKPQVFAANGDTPTGLPEEFHMVIVHLALTELAEFDEAPVTLATHTQRKREMLSLMSEQFRPIPAFTRNTLG